MKQVVASVCKEFDLVALKLEEEKSLKNVQLSVNATEQE